MLTYCQISLYSSRVSIISHNTVHTIFLCGIMLYFSLSKFIFYYKIVIFPICYICTINYERAEELAVGEWVTVNFWLQCFIIRQSLPKNLFNKTAHKDGQVTSPRLYALIICAKQSLIVSHGLPSFAKTTCEVNSATISVAAHCLRGCCSFLSAGIVFSVYHIIEGIAIGKACILTKKGAKNAPWQVKYL